MKHDFSDAMGNWQWREVTHCYDDGTSYAPPMHQKVRGRYLEDSRRCRYCWVIAEHQWGKCDCCGAPL